MSIKVTVDGLEVEVSSTAEALEIIRGLKNSSHEKPTNGRKKAEKAEPDRIMLVETQVLKWALAFLKILRDAGPKGVPTDRLLTAVDAKSTKAVGGRMRLINRFLVESDFSNIYNADKTIEGKIWKARKGIDAAISHTEQQLALHE